MSEPVEGKGAAGAGAGAGGSGSRPGPPQGEAPFVPEAASPAERAAGWKNPPSRMQLMLWSGSKRHVFVGMVGISVLACIPWLMLTSGKKHDSHADYMDRAEGARRARLSNASAAVAPPTSS
ncbi:hypothetical protein M758_2G092100 [Ceratodon purpureus]|nr:hypothetical protein M758_2G092100 [Ceratodon purpureus]